MREKIKPAILCSLADSLVKFYNGYNLLGDKSHKMPEMIYVDSTVGKKNTNIPW
jgi:hypothetical protein